MTKLSKQHWAGSRTAFLWDNITEGASSFGSWSATSTMFSQDRDRDAENHYAESGKGQTLPLPHTGAMPKGGMGNNRAIGTAGNTSLSSSSSSSGGITPTSGMSLAVSSSSSSSSSSFPPSLPLFDDEGKDDDDESLFTWEDRRRIFTALGAPFRINSLGTVNGSQSTGGNDSKRSDTDNAPTSFSNANASSMPPKSYLQEGGVSTTNNNNNNNNNNPVVLVSNSVVDITTGTNNSSSGSSGSNNNASISRDPSRAPLSRLSGTSRTTLTPNTSMVDLRLGASMYPTNSNATTAGGSSNSASASSSSTALQLAEVMKALAEINHKMETVTKTVGKLVTETTRPN